MFYSNKIFVLNIILTHGYKLSIFTRKKAVVLIFLFPLLLNSRHVPNHKS